MVMIIATGSRLSRCQSCASNREANDLEIGVGSRCGNSCSITTPSLSPTGRDQFAHSDDRLQPQPEKRDVADQLKPVEPRRAPDHDVSPRTMFRKSSPFMPLPSGVRGGFGVTRGGVDSQSTDSTLLSLSRSEGAPPGTATQYAPSGAPIGRACVEPVGCAMGGNGAGAGAAGMPSNCRTNATSAGLSVSKVICIVRSYRVGSSSAE